MVRQRRPGSTVIEERAKVRSLQANHVEVEVQRQSACGSCAAKGGCGTSLLADWFPKRRWVFELPNHVDAKPGDSVILGLDEGYLQRGSLLLYASPLAGLLIGAISGEQLFIGLGLSAELGSILLGLFGVFAALLAVRRISFSLNRRSEAGVQLLRVVHRTTTIAPIGISVEEMPRKQELRT